MASSQPEATVAFPDLPDPSSTGEVDFVAPGTTKQCKTWYAIWGEINPATIPLICVHGGPGYPSQHLKPLGLMHQRYGIPVVMYDQLGCGRSTHLPETKGDESFWTLDLFVAELKNLLEKLGIDKHSIFGHSWGGMISTTYALTQPKNLYKLVICSSPASIALRMEASRQQRKLLSAESQRAIETYESEGRLNGPEYAAAMKEFEKLFLFRAEVFPQEFIDSSADGDADDTVSATLFGGTMIAHTGPMRNYDVENELHRIGPTTAPGGVLLLNGKHDMVPEFNVRPFFKNIQARVKWVRFDSSSHMPFWEQADDFALALGEFLTLE